MKIKDYEDIILNIVGILFLVLGIVAVLNSLYSKNLMQVFWACYLGLLLIGFGIIKRNSFIIMSQVYILAIPLILWDIDFLYWIIMQKPLWGITDYFFLERVLNLGKLISLQHLFTIPLSIYAVKKIGLKRRDAWKWSFIQITVVYILVSVLTTPEYNINCVFNPCINLYFGLPYRLTWFIIFFGMTSLTSVVINNFIIKKKVITK